MLRFWDKVDATGGPEACWPWQGARDPYGYGRFGLSGPRRTVLAHRYAAGLHDAAPQLVARHVCDTPSCCNPAHILQGTQHDNVQDAVSRGRTTTGERHGGSVLSDACAQAVRDLRGVVSQRTIAACFGVTQSCVSRIQTERRRPCRPL